MLSLEEFKEGEEEEMVFDLDDCEAGSTQSNLQIKG